MDNYPPGVTGTEPQIAGSDWETWIEGIKPGDPVWHTDGRQGVLVEVLDDAVTVEAEGALDLWDVLDIEQPRTTAFDLWAAAQGEGE